MTTFTSWYEGPLHYEYSELFNQGANTTLAYFRVASCAVQSFLFKEYNMRAVVVRHYGAQKYLTLVWYLNELDKYAYCVGSSDVIPEKFETLRRILYLQEQANMELAEKYAEEEEKAEAV